MMRTLLVLIAILIVAGSLQAKPPNILWISAEDISPDLGCYGDALATTPNLDRLASQGARFDRAYSVAPVCAPSRCSIITGVYATSIGGHNMRCDTIPPANIRCFPEYLRAAGYFCTNNVKADYNFRPPLTAWDESSKNAHWKHRGKDQPFFAVFNFTETHESRAMNLHGEHAHLTDILSPAEKHDPAKLTPPPYYPDTPIVREYWARWYDCVTVMDKKIQSLLDELEQEGLADNTIVFFWGDHGRGLPRGKRWLYDSGTRVPLIVRWPGRIKPGSVRDDLVSLIDLGPTVLSAAGVKVPDYMVGRDIFASPNKPPEYLFGIRDRMDETYDMLRSVRDERFLYIRNFQPEKPYAQRNLYGDNSPIIKEWRRLDREGKLSGPSALFFAKTKPLEELYDSQADPHNIHNLADDPAQKDRLVTMRRALFKWMERTNDQGVIPEPTDSPTTRPDRKHPQCLAPVATIRDNQLQLEIQTPGSSIAYRIGDQRGWKLYAAPITPPSGSRVRVKACRAGFDESEEISVEIP